MSRLEREREVVRAEIRDLAVASSALGPSVINLGGAVCEFLSSEAAEALARRVMYEQELTAAILELGGSDKLAAHDRTALASNREAQAAGIDEVVCSDLGESGVAPPAACAGHPPVSDEDAQDAWDAWVLARSFWFWGRV